MEWCFFWGWLMKASTHKKQKCSSSSDKWCWLSSWSVLWLLAHLLFLLLFLLALYKLVCACVCVCAVSELTWWAAFFSGRRGSATPNAPHLSISSRWLSLLQLSSLWYPHRGQARVWSDPPDGAFSPLAAGLSAVHC